MLKVPNIYILFYRRTSMGYIAHVERYIVMRIYILRSL